MGFPFLFPDFAARRALVDSEASVWKKCPGSTDLDISDLVLRILNILVFVCSHTL